MSVIYLVCVCNVVCVPVYFARLIFVVCAVLFCFCVRAQFVLCVVLFVCVFFSACVFSVCAHSFGLCA